MDNLPSEIYANIRNKALEEAAKVCENMMETASTDWEYGSRERATAYQWAAEAIRALKTQEPE